MPMKRSALCSSPHFANNMRLVRRARDVSQSLLAEITGIHRSVISNYERGMWPTLSDATRIANALNMSLDELTDKALTQASVFLALARAQGQVADQHADIEIQHSLE